MLVVVLPLNLTLLASVPIILFTNQPYPFSLRPNHHHNALLNQPTLVTPVLLYTSSFLTTSINVLCIVSDPYLFLSKHSLLASSIPLPLLATLALHPVLSSYNWPSSPPRSHNFTRILSSQTLHYSSYQYDQTTSNYCTNIPPIHLSNS